MARNTFNPYTIGGEHLAVSESVNGKYRIEAEHGTRWGQNGFDPGRITVRQDGQPVVQFFPGPLIRQNLHLDSERSAWDRLPDYVREEAHRLSDWTHRNGHSFI